MINIIGEIFGTSGYANHTRSLANALNKLTPVKLTTNLVPGFERLVNDQELEMIKREEDLEINLIITHPRFWKVNCYAKRNWVYLVWEGDKVPDWMVNECLNEKIEKIICPSTHTKEALETTLHNCYFHNADEVLDKVEVIHHGVDLKKFYSQEKKDSTDSSNESALGTRSLSGEDNKSEHMPDQADNHPDSFVFLANKGFRNMQDRGGIQYLIQAYLAEFTNKDNVELIIKINPAYGIPNINQMFDFKPDSPKITVIAEDYSIDQLRELYNKCDVFVSPTRAEAFNLPCLEALACGKPVITTNYGGQTDFIDKSVGDLIDFTIDEVKHEVEYEGICWATPIANHLKAIMRDAVDGNLGYLPKPEVCIERAKQFTWDKCAKKFYDMV